MIPGFSTIKTWMRILHGKTHKTENLKSYKGTLLSPNHIVNMIEL